MESEYLTRKRKSENRCIDEPFRISCEEKQIEIRPLINAAIIYWPRSFDLNFWPRSSVD